MLETIKLLLPALLPSWRFFDFIAPSPRIQFALLKSEHETPDNWQEFLPTQKTLSFPQMLYRMFWNPARNEALFLISCAERLLEKPTQHSEDEILKRIIHWLANNQSENLLENSPHLQFRLILIQRHESQLHKTIEFHSRIEPIPPREAT